MSILQRLTSGFGRRGDSELPFAFLVNTASQAVRSQPRSDRTSRKTQRVGNSSFRQKSEEELAIENLTKLTQGIYALHKKHKVFSCKLKRLKERLANETQIESDINEIELKMTKIELKMTKINLKMKEVSRRISRIRRQHNLKHIRNHIGLLVSQSENSEVVENEQEEGISRQNVVLQEEIVLEGAEGLQEELRISKRLETFSRLVAFVVRESGEGSNGDTNRPHSFWRIIYNSFHYTINGMCKNFLETFQNRLTSRERKIQIMERCLEEIDGFFEVIQRVQMTIQEENEEEEEGEVRGSSLQSELEDVGREQLFETEELSEGILFGDEDGLNADNTEIESAFKKLQKIVNFLQEMRDLTETIKTLGNQSIDQVQNPLENEIADDPNENLEDGFPLALKYRNFLKNFNDRYSKVKDEIDPPEQPAEVAEVRVAEDASEEGRLEEVDILFSVSISDATLVYLQNLKAKVDEVERRRRKEESNESQQPSPQLLEIEESIESEDSHSSLFLSKIMKLEKAIYFYKKAGSTGEKGLMRCILQIAQLKEEEGNRLIQELQESEEESSEEASSIEKIRKEIKAKRLLEEAAQAYKEIGEREEVARSRCWIALGEFYGKKADQFERLHGVRQQRAMQDEERVRFSEDILLGIPVGNGNESFDRINVENGYVNPLKEACRAFRNAGPSQTIVYKKVLLKLAAIYKMQAEVARIRSLDVEVNGSKAFQKSMFFYYLNFSLDRLKKEFFIYKKLQNFQVFSEAVKSAFYLFSFLEESISKIDQILQSDEIGEISSLKREAKRIKNRFEEEKIRFGRELGSLNTAVGRLLETINEEDDSEEEDNIRIRSQSLREVLTSIMGESNGSGFSSPYTSTVSVLRTTSTEEINPVSNDASSSSRRGSSSRARNLEERSSARRVQSRSAGRGDPSFRSSSRSGNSRTRNPTRKRKNTFLDILFSPFKALWNFIFRSCCRIG